MVVKPSKDDKNSLDKWKKRSKKGSYNINDWLKILTAKDKEILENIYTEHRDRLMHNAWNKKRQFKADSLATRTRATLHQPKLSKYFN